MLRTIPAVLAREHVATALRLPGNWYRTERMLRAGVRFSRLDAVVFDYHPSTHRGAPGAS